MTILRKIITITAAFAIAEAGWIAWLLAGFSTGGLAVVIERAVARARSSKALRTFKARLGRRPVHREPAPELALSGSW
jgi:hypothetical protein